jgi:hypothetical protein
MWQRLWDNLTVPPVEIFLATAPAIDLRKLFQSFWWV